MSKAVALVGRMANAPFGMSSFTKGKAADTMKITGLCVSPPTQRSMRERARIHPLHETRLSHCACCTNRVFLTVPNGAAERCTASSTQTPNPLPVH